MPLIGIYCVRIFITVRLCRAVLKSYSRKMVKIVSRLLTTKFAIESVVCVWSHQ